MNPAGTPKYNGVVVDITIIVHTVHIVADAVVDVRRAKYPFLLV